MHKCVFESMYTELLMAALQAVDLLSPAKTERDLRALCSLKQGIKQAEQIFYQRQEEEKASQAEQTKKAAPAGRRR